MPGVDVLELGVVPRLAIERLHRAHAAQVLVQEPVHARQPDADVAERAPHFDAKDQRQDHDQRQHRERDAHELGIEAHHRHHDPDEHEHVADDRDHARGEELVQDVHVVREPGHDAAHRMAIEIGDRQPLQVAEELEPQIQHDVLSHPLHDPRLEIGEQVAEHQHRQIEGGDAVQMQHVAVPDAVVDGLLGQVRAGELHHRIEQCDAHRQRDVAAIGAQVAEEAAHEPAVHGAIVTLVFVRHDASSSSSICCRRCSSA